MAAQAPNAAHEGLVRGADATFESVHHAAALRYPRALRHDRMIAQLAIYDPMHQATQLAVCDSAKRPSPDQPGRSAFTPIGSSAR